MVAWPYMLILYRLVVCVDFMEATVNMTHNYLKELAQWRLILKIADGPRLLLFLLFILLIIINVNISYIIIQLHTIYMTTLLNLIITALK